MFSKRNKLTQTFQFIETVQIEEDCVTDYGTISTTSAPTADDSGWAHLAHLRFNQSQISTLILPREFEEYEIDMSYFVTNSVFFLAMYDTFTEEDYFNTEQEDYNWPCCKIDYM